MTALSEPACLRPANLHTTYIMQSLSLFGQTNSSFEGSSKIIYQASLWLHLLHYPT